jgi:hypothetical protein
MTCWEDGGSEPIYVCESHAKELGRSRERCSEVRIITAQPDNGDDPIKSEDRTEPQQIAHTKPNASASSEVACTPTEIKVGPTITDRSVRSPVRDLTYGNSARAMVDEAIWNLAAGNHQVYRAALQQGRSATEAAQAAGGQLAVVHRKISDYTLKLEAVLSESAAMINVAEAIDKPLESSLLEIISNDEMGDLEKDVAIQQLGALQEWVKQGLQRNVTPLRANRIMLAIGNRVNWGGAADISESIEKAYRALYGSLRTAIRAAIPQAQDLHERLTNLYAAKSELETC